MTCPYTISGIKDGQYTVAIDLLNWMCPDRIRELETNLQYIRNEDPYFKEICPPIKNYLLEYTSETLLPMDFDLRKKKVLLILGNPATHSVKKKMICYSKVNDERHPIWKKLKDANLIEVKESGKKDKIDQIEEEAQERKKLIISGNTCNDHVIGFTTFYSFPTPTKPSNKKDQQKWPAKNYFGNAAGVERLFRGALDKLQKMELGRLYSYSFAINGIWIFTQTSSYRYVKNFNRIDYWPIRGSDGEDLRQILSAP